MYVIGDWVYTKLEQPDMPPETSGWLSFWSPGFLEQQDIASQQAEILADFVDLKVPGTEVVSGIECYKMRATPDLGKIWAGAEPQYLQARLTAWFLRTIIDGGEGAV